MTTEHVPRPPRIRPSPIIFTGGSAQDDDLLIRTLYALGGTATAQQLRDVLPMGLSRQHDKPTRLHRALVRGVLNGWLATSDPQHAGVYYLRDAGYARAGLPARSSVHLNELLSQLDRLAACVRRLLEGSVDWPADEYAQIEQHLRSACDTAALAATCAGAADNPSAYLSEVYRAR